MISVVIVNWNSGTLLEKCVSSLYQYAAGCEIVVVDNASEDHSVDFISSLNSGTVLIRLGSNLGFAAANNAGWRQAGGDPVLFLNPDVECTQGAVESLRQALADSPSHWACAGKLIRASTDDNAETSVRRFPTLSSVAAELLLLDEIWPQNPWTARYRMRGEDFSKDREVEQPAAACVMILRKAMESVGGFDESFCPAWFEDVDLCKRVHDAGGSILYHPSAQFRHHGGYSLGKLPYGKFLEYYHTNQIRYFAKHHGPANARRVRTLVVAGMRLRAALSMMRSPVSGMSRGQSFRLFSAAARRFSEAGTGST